jgi:CBS domain-containing protein
MKTLYATRIPDSPGRLTRRRVTDVMQHPAPTVPGRTPLHEALATMVRLHARHLVAVDDTGRCLGVLSDRGIAARWALDASPLLRQTVLSALDAKPAIIPANWVIANAAKFMLGAGVDAVAVADPEGRPVGLLTANDLVAQLAATAETP